MKISYSYEQTSEETEAIQKTSCCIVDKILSFGEKIFNVIAADKAASRNTMQFEQLERLNRTIENLSYKVDKLEAAQKFQNNNHCKK